MEFLELVKARYSCKNYGNKAVDDKDLELILEAGRQAPTAKNNQPQSIYVVKSDEAKEKVYRATACKYNAPVILVVAYDSENVFTYPGGKGTSGPEDASIVATHMMLAAKSVGVDSCWINNFDPEVMAAELGLPANEKVVMLLYLGYPADGVGPLPNHGSRKPISETVKFI